MLNPIGVKFWERTRSPFIRAIIITINCSRLILQDGQVWRVKLAKKHRIDMVVGDGQGEVITENTICPRTTLFGLDSIFEFLMVKLCTLNSMISLPSKSLQAFQIHLHLAVH